MNVLDWHTLRTRTSAVMTILGAVITIAVMAAPGTAAAASSTPARCRTGMLSVKLSSGNGTLGSTYYQLKFKNISRTTCSLYGYPGVSALRNGKQLGLAASETSGVTPHTVVLQPNATAKSQLRVIDVFNFSPQQCKPRQATQLRVYPPGAFIAKLIPKKLEGCSSKDTFFVYMNVEAVK